VVAFLKEMGPSAIDAELQSLAPEGGGSIELMGDFLIFINEMLKTNKNFELIQAYLGLFLKVSLQLDLLFICSSYVNVHGLRLFDSVLIVAIQTSPNSI